MASAYALLGTFVLAMVAAHQADARLLPKFKHCNDEAIANIEETLRFLEVNVEDLKRTDDAAFMQSLDLETFSLGRRRNQIRRVKRRLARKLGKLRFSCRDGVLCRDSQEKRFGLHAFRSASKKIRLCYRRMVEDRYMWCDLVEVITHELGHAVGMPKDVARRHSKNGNDRVYQFGFLGYELCRNRETDHVLHTTIEIKQPLTGQPLVTGWPVQFRAETKSRDLMAPRVTWSSDIDGELGTGEITAVPSLSVGTHRVTAEAVDGGGFGDMDEKIYVVVEGAPCSGSGCCVPDCQNKQCGDDGCGGTCGSCGQDKVCHESSRSCVEP